MKKISVIGLGYIGLPTAALLAEKNVEVVGIDIIQNIITSINAGEIHIVEPGLGELVKKVVAKRKLRASLIPEASEAFIITVPTPIDAQKKPDIMYIKKAIEAIATVLKRGDLIILESTSPVGTTEKMANLLTQLRPDLTFPPNANGNVEDVSIAYCPERVLPGKTLHELVGNSRIIGGLSKHSTDQAASLYQIFVKGTLEKTDARTAELCKLSENSYRDVNIAFANELSMISDSLNINVWELIRLANLHPRVNILQPGPGVGGHCISVDPWFIVDSAPEIAKLIKTARQVNDHKPKYLLEGVKHIIQAYGNLKIACFGLSFKADIDDLRESPAVELVKGLSQESESTVYVVEPHIDYLPSDLLDHENVILVDANTAIKNAAIIILLVNHKQFYELEIHHLSGKHIIDTRGIWQTRNLEE